MVLQLGVCVGFLVGSDATKKRNAREKEIIIF